MDNADQQFSVRERTEQVLRELFGKVAQVVVQSRVPYLSFGGRIKTNKWFNLELEELDIVNEDLLPWRTNLYLPLYIYISFVSPEGEKILLELWKISLDQSLTKPPSEASEIPSLYKKLVLLLRIAYGRLRILPAYNFYRYCRKNKSAATKMVFEFRRDDYSAFGRNERPLELKFESIQTVLGKLQISVLYTENVSLKQLTKTNPLITSEFIIQDYQRNDGSFPVSNPVGIPNNETRSSRPIGIPSSGNRTSMDYPAFSPPSSITTSNRNRSSSDVFANAFTTGAFSPPFSNTGQPIPSPGYSKPGPLSSTPPFSYTPPSSVPSTSPNSVISKSSKGPVRVPSLNRLSVSPFQESPIQPDSLLAKMKLDSANADPMYPLAPSEQQNQPLMKLSLLLSDNTFDTSANPNQDHESEIGLFVSQCQASPALSMFADASDNYATVQMMSLYDTLTVLQNFDASSST